MRFEQVIFKLQDKDSRVVVQVKVLLVLRIGQQRHLIVVHFLWTLVEELVNKVDFFSGHVIVAFK